MEYRRAYLPGGTYFFTLVTENRRKVLQAEPTIAVLRQAFLHVMARRPFHVGAAVILPDHLHCIWTLPENDCDYSTRWRLIKMWFTKHCDPGLRVESENARKRKGEQAIWQHRFWEHLIRDEDDYARHVEYIHYNPVKHGYVRRPLDWPYSSFRGYVRTGIYDADWGATDVDFPENIGLE